LAFTRSRSEPKNGRAYVKQKIWHIVRRVAGYHLYDTAAKLELLNQIRAVQRLTTKHLGPQQKLVSKAGNGAKGTETYDTPKMPLQGVLADTGTAHKSVQSRLLRENEALNPVAIQRQTQALTAQLLKLTTKQVRVSSQNIFARILT